MASPGDVDALDTGETWQVAWVGIVVRPVAEARVAAPDCVSPTQPGERQPNLHPRTHRDRDRLDAIPV